MRLKNFSLNYGVQIYKAFSESSRVRIINILFTFGKATTSDLELILDFSQAKTSRHLIYLKNSGILSIEKRDQWVFYSIKEEVMDIIAQMIKFIEKDSLLLNDLETCKVLLSNRELALNKVEKQKYIAKKNTNNI
ncbi:MAG TPA: metalloregulator ArsR/SmtB family transcription factor [Cytophagales bacterium]|nr:metalloregulator ArsR/SmtB family transcription factor [Cytophagales bacterium]